MENNQVFTYRYSAAQNREVERIREKYLPREESRLELLRKLDRRVQSAGMIEGLTVGVVGCLIFGIGMCFGLGVFGGGNWLAILFGVLGTAVMLPAYPLYRRIARKTREALTPEILRLSEEIMRS
ncbi:MAG: hypothetical protein IJW99_05425 [Clostridia bacterium]|nr:hypothetical protein [Clostridia bacterium]